MTDGFDQPDTDSGALAWAAVMLGAFGVVLIALKLCGWLAWGWAVVLIPFWVPAALLVGFVGVVLAICGVVKLTGARHS